LEGLRFSGLASLVDVWRTGTHVADVAQECCALALLLTPSHNRAIAHAGAADCAITTWQRFGKDTARGSLVQATAELMLACLSHLPEKPQLLPQLAADSLRTQFAAGEATLIAVLLRALAKLGEDAKLASELCSLNVPTLALLPLTDDRYVGQVALRRLAAQAFTRPTLNLAEASRAPALPRCGQLPLCSGHAPAYSPRHSLEKRTSLPGGTIQSRVEFAAMSQASLPSSLPASSSAHLPLGRPSALPTADVAAMAAIGQAPEPTLDSKTCAAALRRRLEAWGRHIKTSGPPPTGGYAAHAVAVCTGGAVEDPPPALRMDGDFESGSLGIVQRLGAHEYELQLLPDVLGSGAHVQWFCFRIRGMRPQEPYTFHLTNLGKPGSLFDEGCQPVLFSKHRHTLNGEGWTRAGTDIAYYPCDITRRYCITFDVTFPHGEDDEVFMAHAVPYTHSDCLADMRRWQHPSEIRRWAIAHSCGGQDVTAISLGNPEAKLSACVIARAHPGETNASWVMRGFMDFLLGGGAEAEACLRNVRWFVVPMLNPDGVASGRTRTNLEGVDLNRHHHDNAAPETRGLRAALQDEVLRPQKPLAFIDIHSHSRRRGVFFITNSSEGDALVNCLAARSPLLDAPGTSRPDVRPQDEGVGRVAGARLGYQYSATLESSLSARHSAAGGEHLSLDDLQAMGRALCLALLDAATLGEDGALQPAAQAIVEPSPTADAIPGRSDVVLEEGLASQVVSPEPKEEISLASPIAFPTSVLQEEITLASPIARPVALPVVASPLDLPASALQEKRILASPGALPASSPLAASIIQTDCRMPNGSHQGAGDGEFKFVF